MAAPGGKFFIQDAFKKTAAHHASYAKLWETKWNWPVRTACNEVVVLTLGMVQLTSTSTGWDGRISVHVWREEGL